MKTSPPPPAEPSLSQGLLAEAVGTAALLALVVGSGVMGERLAAGNTALALLANALATGAGLLALILALGGISGAHFNPLVTILLALRGDFPRARVAAFILVQVLGALAGVALAHGMFDLPLLQASGHIRSGVGQWLSEAVAAAGLLVVIVAVARHRPTWTPVAVASFVTAGYWFTASTCFANPAVAVARAWTDTFAGIRPLDVPGFILAEAVGLGLAWALLRLLVPTSSLPKVSA
jgi:glycerol uptake facilitator-like aquaporin